MDPPSTQHLTILKRHPCMPNWPVVLNLAGIIPRDGSLLRTQTKDCSHSTLGTLSVSISTASFVSLRNTGNRLGTHNEQIDKNHVLMASFYGTSNSSAADRHNAAAESLREAVLDLFWDSQKVCSFLWLLSSPCLTYTYHRSLSTISSLTPTAEAMSSVSRRSTPSGAESYPLP
jgi:hypothetical protein